jgi:N-succinyldiaminopimelate aminotransferase
MNPHLHQLQPYPFAKLRQLLSGTGPAPEAATLIDLSIGEPKHQAPAVVKDALIGALDGLSGYPPTKGSGALRGTISQWISRRYNITPPDPETQILPVLGSREALFSVAQTVIDPNAGACVLSPNPFYQIYEGAAILAGAQPIYVNADEEHNFLPDWRSVEESTWRKTQLVYVCSPANPAGSVMPLADWQFLFEKADEHGFVIASDECYSEIYLDEDQPPLGSLQAAATLGRTDFKSLISFTSLSKRSNLPGLRSGFVAGDASLIGKFLLYRTYHGSAMSGVISAASIAAWQDEDHVRLNRQAYREKFNAVIPILSPVIDVRRPSASFYLWVKTPYDDTEFTRDLYTDQAVKVLPGSYISRTSQGLNPGSMHVRIALVAPLEECVEGAKRMVKFIHDYSKTDG